MSIPLFNRQGKFCLTSCIIAFITTCTIPASPETILGLEATIIIYITIYVSCLVALVLSIILVLFTTRRMIIDRNGIRVKGGLFNLPWSKIDNVSVEYTYLNRRKSLYLVAITDTRDREHKFYFSDRKATDTAVIDAINYYSSLAEQS